jgi:hypothetical protein
MLTPYIADYAGITCESLPASNVLWRIRQRQWTSTNVSHIARKPAESRVLILLRNTLFEVSVRTRVPRYYSVWMGRPRLLATKDVPKLCKRGLTTYVGGIPNEDPCIYKSAFCSGLVHKMRR